MTYLLLVAVSLILGLGTQWYINHTYRTWSNVPIDVPLTGGAVARRFLDSEGLDNVAVIDTNAADLSDFYDPRSDELHLSRSSATRNSVADVAVACHEAGHAVQHARAYGPARIRMAIVPVVNIGSQAWMLVLVLGIIMNVSGLVTAGIVLFGLVVAFQLVTLPVEFDASGRALRYLEGNPYFTAEQVRGARKMLTAAALTYVASALTSILQLVYLLGQRDD